MNKDEILETLKNVYFRNVFCDIDVERNGDKWIMKFKAWHGTIIELTITDVKMYEEKIEYVFPKTTDGGD